MQSTKHRKRKPTYGIYAWPYLAAMTLLGLLGIAIILISIVTDGYLQYPGFVLTAVGFYAALGHYSLMKVFEKKDNDFAREILDFIEPANSKLILDIGTGAGRTAIAVAKISAYNQVVGIDVYSKKTIYGNSPRKAGENAEIEGVDDRVLFIYGDALKIPFRNQCFDIVTAGSVLHMFTEKKRKHALKEALRVLKNRGKLILIELPRTAKVTLLYLLPAFFIFQTREYWIRLLRENHLENIKAAMIGDISVFCSEKKSSPTS